MEGCRYKLRVVRYHEQWEENGEKAERFMWLVTTLETAGYRVLCEMMNRRWNADNWIIYKNAQIKKLKAKFLYCYFVYTISSVYVIIQYNTSCLKKGVYE